MVKVYLLLRNNKQSGPFSIDELTAQKLRPMDLIWIEGRSSAWQYASEISMLKHYLSHGENSAQTNTDPHSAYLPAEEKIKTQSQQISPKIYVSLPGSSKAEKKTPLTNSPVSSDPQVGSNDVVTDPPVTKSPVFSDPPQKKSEPVRPVQKIRPPEFREKLVTNYSSSLEEKEEAYTSWIYQKKTKKSGLSPEWMGGIAVVLLLFMGTAAYLVKNHMNSNDGKELTATDTRNTEELVSTAPPPDPVVSQVAQTTELPPTEPRPESLPVATPAEPANNVNATTLKPVSATVPTKKKTNPPAEKATPATVNAPKSQEQQVILPTVVKTPEPVSKSSENSSNSKTSTPEVDPKKTKKTFSEKVDGFFNRMVHAKKVEPGAPANSSPTESPAEPPTVPGNRKANRRDDQASTPIETPKKDLSAGLAITTIEPSNNWMQGVHGLKMKVDNRNGVKVTNASVEIRYLNEQNAILEKKTIKLTDIPAGKSITMAIPDHRLADHAEASLISAGN